METGNFSHWHRLGKKQGGANPVYTTLFRVDTFQIKKEKKNELETFGNPGADSNAFWSASASTVHTSVRYRHHHRIVL